MTLLILGAATVVTVVQASPKPSKPVADPFGGGGQGAASSLQATANDPFAPPPPPPMIANIDVEETRLEDLLEFVKDQLREQGEAPPNFVFREGAEKQVISSLRLRNVSLEGLLQVLETVLDMDINTVKNPGGEDIIVLRSPNVLPDSGAVRVRSIQSNPRLSLATPPGNPQTAAENARKQAAELPVTKVFATSDLGVDEENLMSAIRAVWDTSDGDWDKGEDAAKLLFHPGTRMLVLKASPERLEDVEQIMQQLGLVKEREQSGELADMRRRLQDVERSNQRTFRQMEEAHERTIVEMKNDRSRLMEKISELEMELRRAQMQRVRTQDSEKAREGGH